MQIKFPDFSLIWSIFLNFPDFTWLEKSKTHFPGWLGTLFYSLKNPQDIHVVYPVCGI